MQSVYYYQAMHASNGNAKTHLLTRNRQLTTEKIHRRKIGTPVPTKHHNNTQNNTQNTTKTQHPLRRSVPSVERHRFVVLISSGIHRFTLWR